MNGANKGSVVLAYTIRGAKNLEDEELNDSNNY